MTPRSLPLRDTEQAYGKVTRLLHWSIAALMLWQFFGMGLRLLLGRTPLVSFFVGWHQPVGTVLFLLIVLRVGWALANRSRRPDHGPGFWGLAARLGHLALYLVMVLVPVAALLRAYGGERSLPPSASRSFRPSSSHRLDGRAGRCAAWRDGLAAPDADPGPCRHGRRARGMWRDGTLARMAGRRRAGLQATISGRSAR